jgi:hypothetical protein
MVVAVSALVLASPARGQALEHLWSQGFGDRMSNASDFGGGIAVDGACNVLVSGFFQGTVDFGGGPITSAGENDLFVVKFDADGNHLWSHGFGDTGPSDGSRGIAVDGAGNVLVAGQFQGTVDFGGGPITSAGSLDICIVKFDADGNHLWSHGFGDTLIDEGIGIAVDGAGNVLVTGCFAGTVDFGGGPIFTAGSTGDIFVVKFDADGNHVWSRGVGGTANDSGFSIATDSAGNVLVTGLFANTVDFGGGSFASAGGSDIFVVKFDANGNHLWSEGFGDVSSDQGRGIAADGADNVLVTGRFEEMVDFGDGSITSAGSLDIFLVKFDAGGNHLWSHGFGDTSFFDWGFSVAADSADNVLMTGLFSGTVDFGGGPITSAGGSDIVVARFDADGNHLSSQPFGDTGFDEGRSIAVDGADNVAVTGDFGGTVNFGGGPITSAGGPDIFVVKFGPFTDGDGDGVPDDEDDCPQSILDPTIVIGDCDSGVENILFDDGCTMSDLIALCADGADKHGQFVACVAQLTNAWMSAGLITGQEKGKIQSCAAKAPADLNSDQAVDMLDFLLLLGTWSNPLEAWQDVEGDGQVGFEEFLRLLGAWGPLP